MAGAAFLAHYATGVGFGPVFFALNMVIIVHPLHAWLVRRLRWPVWLAAITALAVVLIALVVLLVFWLIARVVQGLVQRVWGGREDNLGRLFGRLASGAILVLGVLVGLTIVFPSVTPASLFSLLGVGGVAIGFAESPPATRCSENHASMSFHATSACSAL